jgi:hypothetical protein
MQLFLSGGHVVQAVRTGAPQGKHNRPPDQSGSIEEREE